jgi:hypothetical protein
MKRTKPATVNSEPLHISGVPSAVVVLTIAMGFAAYRQCRWAAEP